MIMGGIQMHPSIRRRAAQRGLSKSIVVTFIFVVIGFVSFVNEDVNKFY